MFTDAQNNSQVYVQTEAYLTPFHVFNLVFQKKSKIKRKTAK